MNTSQHEAQNKLEKHLSIKTIMLLETSELKILELKNK